MNQILPGEPEEGFLEVVVRFGRDVVVLKVLLAVEHDGLGLHLPVLDVHFVAGEDDRDVLADPDEVPVPVGDVLVGDARGDVEHDDGALALEGEGEQEAVRAASPGCSTRPAGRRTSPGPPCPTR